MTPIFYFWDGRALCFGWTERCCRNPLKNNNTAGGSSLPLVLRTRGPALLGAGGPLIASPLLAEFSRRRALTLLNRLRQEKGCPVSGLSYRPHLAI